MTIVSSNTLTTMITSVFSIREGQRSKILSLYFDCLSIPSSLVKYITPFLTTIHQGISLKASNQGLTSSSASEKPPMFGVSLTAAPLHHWQLLMGKVIHTSALYFYFLMIHILYTVLFAFPMVLRRRICLTIRGFLNWWSFPLFSWTLYLIQGRHRKEKWDTRHS